MWDSTVPLFEIALRTGLIYIVLLVGIRLTQDSRGSEFEGREFASGT